MKTSISYSLILAAASCGMALGQTTAYTTPVGYESLPLVSGLNFVGVRLHEGTIAAGTLDSFSTAPNRVTDAQLDLGALITSGGTYILEIQDGSGIIQEVVSATGTSLNVAADLSSLTYPVSYKLRPASNFPKVFGTTFSAGKLDKSGLTIGSFSAAGADQVWLWNGSDFDQYYFDEFTEASGFATAGWVNLAAPTVAVNAATLNLIYADGFVISSAAGADITIAGEVKTGPTELNLTGGVLNFVGSVSPTGINLSSAFGTTFTPGSPGTLSSGLAIGSFGAAGADQVFIWNGTDFNKYYFDEFTEASGFSAAGWVDLSNPTAPVDASSILLDPGYIISPAAGRDVVQGVPAGYSSL